MDERVYADTAPLRAAREGKTVEPLMTMRPPTQRP